MLEYLRLTNVGPAPSMEMELAPRLNLLTGDNGLGKSFLLDVAWWALTRKWPREVNPRLTSGYPASPVDPARPAAIEFRVGSVTKPVAYTSDYVAVDQAWKGRQGRPWNPGLVIYALADGGFAVWDPMRNYWKTENGVDLQDVVPAYVFSAQDVWDGLDVMIDGRPTRVCNGLIADWATWIKSGSGATMERALGSLSGHALVGATSSGRLGVGSAFARLSVNDARDVPTIKMPYGHEVPVVHAALGVRRVVALAYMLIWSRLEHALAAKRRGQPLSQRTVLLIDEVEAHLHPRWQRTIIPAVLRTVEDLATAPEASVQILAATHSPLVLASAEPYFDEGRDKLFTLGMDHGQVTLREQTWAKQGDVVNWLVSDTFGLEQARSVEAQRAIEAAEAWMRGATAELPPDLATAEAIDAELRRVLAGHDAFWPRWVLWQRGIDAP